MTNRSNTGDGQSRPTWTAVVDNLPHELRALLRYVEHDAVAGDGRGVVGKAIE